MIGPKQRAVLDEGHLLVAEVPAKRAAHRAWVDVWPRLDENEESVASFFVRRFEISAEHIQKKNDTHGDELVDVESKEIHSEAELLVILERWLEGATLVPPGEDWDYPF